MTFLEIEKYIDRLYNNQNIGLSRLQKGLYSKEEYYKLFRDVITIFNKDIDIDEAREILYKESKIEDRIKRFIFELEAAPGTVITYGTNKYRETIVIGNKQEIDIDGNYNKEIMEEDSIFDLASITKIFMSFSILKLVQDGLINLTDKVTKYVPEFINLENVTILDLLSFNVPLKTIRRIDEASDVNEAEDILKKIYIDYDNDNFWPYTDMGVMVLRYVLEKVMGINYYDYLKEFIFNKLEMNEMYIKIPNSKLDRVVSTNMDGKIYNDGSYIINKEPGKGISYDKKARILGNNGEFLVGHAGLFSTVNDMAKLSKGVINNNILDNKYLDIMIKNRTGRKYRIDGVDKYRQYFGLLCFLKNPDKINSHLFYGLSGKSFASIGWTGNHLEIDYLNKLYLFMGSNRSHNRMTYIDNKYKDKVKILDNGKKIFMLPNGIELVDSTNFSKEKNVEVINPLLELLFKYKMLEDIYSINKIKINNKELVRKIL